MNFKSYISKKLQQRRAESLYDLLCQQARETTDVCTFYRYRRANSGDDWFIEDTAFFDISKIPSKRSAIVFGSGPSALSFSKEKIVRLKEDYLIVGFNFASLLDISFDLYFFEGLNIDRLGQKLLDAAYFLAGEGTSVVLKSVWMHAYPSLKDLAAFSRQDNFSLLRSYKLASISHEWILPSKAPLIYLKKLFSPHELDAGYYKEAFTTMLTILPILKSAGIENIHLIGCDMNQDYFFRSPEYVPIECKTPMIPNEQELPRTYSALHATAVHPLENVLTMMPLVNTLGLANVTIDSSVQGPLGIRLPRKTL